MHKSLSVRAAVKFAATQMCTRIFVWLAWALVGLGVMAVRVSGFIAFGYWAMHYIQMGVDAEQAGATVQAATETAWQALLSEKNTALVFFVGAALLFLALRPLSSMYMLALMRYDVALCTHHKRTIRSLIPSFKTALYDVVATWIWWTMQASILIVSMFAMLGLALVLGEDKLWIMIFPGAVAALAIAWLSYRTLFYQFLIADRHVGPLDSLAMSWRLTRGGVGKLFVASCLFALCVAPFYVLAGIFTNDVLTNIFSFLAPFIAFYASALLCAHLYKQSLS